MSDQPPESKHSLRGGAPERLVLDGSTLFGSWLGIPGRANLIDARPYPFPLPRAVKRLRLKEWQAIQAGDSEWFLMAVLYDAKFTSMASLDVWNRREKRSYGFRRLFPGSRFSLPESLERGETSIGSPGDRLSIATDMAAGTLTLEAHSKSRKAPLDLALRFDLAPGKCFPSSACMPLGLNRAIYSTKILLPCSGTIVAGGPAHHLDPASASGILDDHKGYYPYRLHYDWVTGFGVDASGRRIAFNLTDNQVRDQAAYNENRLWTDGRVDALPPVKITRPNGPGSPWIIQDTEGMVDLVFHPEAAHQIKVRLGLAEIDYEGPFGRFEGELRAATGEMVDASPLFGMGEDKHVRM